MFLNRTYNTDGLQAPRGNFSFNKGSPQAQNLISWYPLQEGAGAVVRDLVRNDEATFLNSPTWNDGSQSLGSPYRQFGNNTVFFDNDDNDAIDFRTNFFGYGIRQHGTISVWAMWTGVEAGSPQYFSDWLLSKGLECRISTATFAIVAFVYPNNHRITTANNVIAAKTWHLIHLVLDGANMHVYVDGLSVGTQTLGEDLGNSGTIARLGQRGTSSSSAFDGYGFDFRIRKVALTPAQVYQEWGPETRWDLYWQPSTKLYYFPVVAATGTSFPPWKIPITHLLAR